MATARMVGDWQWVEASQLAALDLATPESYRPRHRDSTGSFYLQLASAAKASKHSTAAAERISGKCSTSMKAPFQIFYAIDFTWPLNQTRLLS
jgi:hypothetical protein